MVCVTKNYIVFIGLFGRHLPHSSHKELLVALHQLTQNISHTCWVAFSHPLDQ